MSPIRIFEQIQVLTSGLARVGAPLQWALLGAAALLGALAVVPAWRRWLPFALAGTTALLVAGEIVLAWFHWRLYGLAAVTDPTTGAVAGHVAVPLWVESEKLYVWALVLAVLGVLMRRHRRELMTGTAAIVALLLVGAVLLGKPFTQPLPEFLGQYAGYLQATAAGGQAAQQAYQGMEGARQYYYNAWFMWVHPPLLFFSYGCFALSFVATLRMIAEKHSSFETTAYRWARLGFLSLTVGMLVGFPWALSAWSGQSWWWSGKVNMSLMMWLMYTAYLHARLYLRRRGLWKVVAVLAILSFVILVLTYITTYVVPGAHSYAGGA